MYVFKRLLVSLFPSVQLVHLLILWMFFQYTFNNLYNVVEHNSCVSFTPYGVVSKYMKGVFCITNGHNVEAWEANVHTLDTDSSSLCGDKALHYT